MRHIRRRTLLKSAAASLIVPTAMTSSRPSRASTLRGIQAVYFDGKTCIRNNGTIPNFPTTSPYGIVSTWFNSAEPVLTGALPEPPLIVGYNPKSPDKRFQVICQHQAEGENIWSWLGPTSAGQAEILVTPVTPSGAAYRIPHDGQWHHFLMGFNTRGSISSTNPISQTVAVIYIDNQFITPWLGYWGPGTATPSDIAWPGLTWQLGQAAPASKKGGAGFTTGNYIGSQAETHIIASSTYIDINDPDVRAGFIDPDALVPVRNRFDGSVPIFDSSGNIKQTLQAQIHLSGGAVMFPKNFPGWKFATFDDFMNGGAPGTEFVSATDPGPSSFYTAAGLLQTATVDPWGFTGEA